MTYSKVFKNILWILILFSLISQAHAYTYVKDTFNDESMISGKTSNIIVAEGKACLTNPNLVSNPNVESGSGSPDDWYAGANTEWSTAEARTGTHSLKICVNGQSGDWRSKYYLVNANVNYHVEAYVKGNVISDEFYFTARWFSNNDGSGFISESNIAIAIGTYDAWTLKQNNFTSPSNAESSDLLFRTINGNGTVYMDDFVFKFLNPQGMVYSVNLLADMNATGITSFRYDCSVSSEAKLQVQFSQNNRTWFSGDNVQDSWDNLDNGIHEIDLTRLNWKADYFFYRANFTGTINVLSCLYEITVYYTTETTEATSWFQELFYGTAKWITLTILLAIIIAISTIFPYGGVLFLPITIFLGFDYFDNVPASSDFMWGALMMLFASIYVVLMIIRKARS